MAPPTSQASWVSGTGKLAWVNSSTGLPLTKKRTVVLEPEVRMVAATCCHWPAAGHPGAIKVVPV